MHYTELIDYYRNRCTSVYVTFLDASKAFDRINHWLLFDKLLEREMPCYIVRIMLYWYRSQIMFVKWGNCDSSSFTVTNGVRQGGVLSPKLLIVYMDGLSEQLNNSNIGSNHISYADDMCLLSFSSAGMQKLLNIWVIPCQFNKFLDVFPRTPSDCFEIWYSCRTW